MVADIKENIFLYDWLTFTTTCHSLATLKEELGLTHVQWTDFTGHGRYGYRDRMEFGSIHLLFNGREDMGICVEMSGTGCRTFEDHTTLTRKWDDLLSFVLSEDVHITRLDVAFDDHTGLLDIDRISSDTLSLQYVSRLRAYKVEVSGKTDTPVIGKSVTFGSRASNVLIRIYDKAAERGFTDGRHWIRVEIQLRDDRAYNFLDLCRSFMLGEAFSGVVLNYLRFIEPDPNDSNKSRWSMADYWAEFLKGASRISIFATPGGEYNEQRLTNYVTEMAGNAISCFVDMYGLDTLTNALKNRHAKPNKKYELLKKKHDAALERLQDAAKLLFETDQSDNLVWGFNDSPVEAVSSSVPVDSEWSTLPVFDVCNTPVEQLRF